MSGRATRRCVEYNCFRAVGPTAKHCQHHDPAQVAARKERGRLRDAAPALLAACRAARDELAVAASYADEPDIAVGLRVHARACAKALAIVDAAIASAVPAKEPT